MSLGVKIKMDIFKLVLITRNISVTASHGFMFMVISRNTD